MVLLTMTQALVEALRINKDDLLQKHQLDSRPVDGSPEKKSVHEEEPPDCSTSSVSNHPFSDTQAVTSTASEIIRSSEPSLDNPKVGNPISHGQIVDLAKEMKSRGSTLYRLERLLKGSTIYTPPPPAKPKPSSEYQALMARLRREEEARSYERMINPPPPMETFAQRFPTASAAYAFSANHSASPETEDEVTYADIDRQIAVIFNVLVSIVACAAAIWIAARWWSTPMRLALSMSGSMLVGVAEVVVYTGYIRRVGEAKGKEKAIKEVREVVNTWLVGPDKVDDTNYMQIESENPLDDSTVRKRK